MIDQQLRSNDCGISAAKTVCNLLGIEISRELIEDHLILDQQGASMASIDRFFKHFSFESRFQLLDVNSIEENEAYVNSLCPFITPVKSSAGLHYWVIEKLKNGKFYVLDPANASLTKLSLQEFRNRAFFSKSLLELVELEDVLRAKISEELYQRSISLPIAEASGKTLVEVFNKLNYFQYIQKNFPFQSVAIANAYLSDLLLNQDLGAVPKSFRSLSIQKDQLEIEAPVLLSIKKTEQTVQPEHDEGQENIYLKLFKSISGIRDLWAIFVATTILIAGITYLSVFINQILIDDVLPSYQINTLALFAIGVGIFSLFELIFTTFKRYFSIHLGNVFDKYFLTVYDSRLNNYSIRYLQSFRRGDLVERLSDSLKIKTFFMTFFSQIFINAVVAVCSIGILMMINWSLTMLVFIVLGVFVGLYFWLTPRIQMLENQRFAKKADFFSRFIEKIEGIQVIKSLQLEHYSSEGIRTNINALVDVQTKARMLGLFNSVTSSFVTSFATLAIIVLASREMIMNNGMSLGMIITFITLSRKIFSAFDSLLDYNLDLQENRVILQRFFDFKEQAIDKQVSGARGNKILDFKLQNLQLENVNFAYNDDKYVLSGLNLNIWMGEKIWIQGRNGAGKSTMCKVLSLLYPPQGGGIKINGIDATLYDERRLKSKIAFIASDDLIFNESILFNITFGQPTDLKEIIRYAKAIDFYEFIDSHPEKFDYVLHEKGGNLSTGQRRKLLLLRALMTKADFLILDEIFNGIDDESKYKAETLLNGIDNRAFIIISHTPMEGIEFTQKYKLTNGQLLEQATESIYAN